MTAARRATSACRPSGLSWRRSSAVRSCSRVRLACIASSLRSAFSLRLRCLRTPAASSMKPRRSSGVGVQDGVELALADDDVHLAADAGVREQLLDVEQPARRAVDRVLGAAVAEHRPRDRDLGVVDRQRAVGVVDREETSARPSGGRPGGAGEDDVLHLAAAQRLGALLAHHPGEGVDDVGLARAVRSDDAGDARLEAQRRRRGERLEAAQGQALEVQEEKLQARGRQRVTGKKPHPTRARRSRRRRDARPSAAETPR